MKDTFNLQRFIEAQQSVYKDVLNELKQGKKRSHWMWFVFPQIKGLGESWIAQQYAINSLEEAKAYLGHHLLGKRLRTCTQLVINIKGRTASEIFGYPDDLKLCSSMTLFDQVDETSQIFKDALVKYYGGKSDKLTIKGLKKLMDM